MVGFFGFLIMVWKASGICFWLGSLLIILDDYRFVWKWRLWKF
jgi:hypothetical protein